MYYILGLHFTYILGLHFTLYVYNSILSKVVKKTYGGSTNKFKRVPEFFLETFYILKDLFG
jgi:hypothetical protein